MAAIMKESYVLLGVEKWAIGTVYIRFLLSTAGNKADCGNERQVKREDGDRLAREYNVAFMETSAKSGLNVDLTFLAVAR